MPANNPAQPPRQTVPPPKLRFKQFEETSQWEVKRLDEISERVKGRIVQTNDKQQGIPYIGAKAFDGNFKEYTDDPSALACQKGDVLILWDGEYAGNSTTGLEGAVSSTVARLRLVDTVNPTYIHLNLQRNISLIRESRTGSGIPHMASDFERWYTIPLPSLSEQTHIAAALSSLDDLITAHADRLEALRQHKRGLMQQLFPREGETVLRLRFPEFVDAGAWEMKKLGNVAHLTAGATPSTSKKEFWGGEIPWMASGDIHKKRVKDVDGRITELGLNSSSTKLLPVNCVLVALAGQGKTRGTVATNAVELCTNQSIAAILPGSEVNYKYLFFNLDGRYEELRALSTGEGGRGGLNLGILRDVSIPLPSLPEQTRIAECLSSLNDLITAQADKVAALQTFKRGLMQGLFPAV